MQMKFAQEVKEISIGGTTYWVACRSWVDTIYRWFGGFTYTNVGSRVYVLSERPGEFSEPHWAVKFFCSFPIIGWFCGLAAALGKPKSWQPDRGIEITVRTRYYTRSGTQVGDVETNCSGVGECGPGDLSASGGAWVVNYPNLGTESVVAVRTDGRVRIDGVPGEITLTSIATAGQQIPV